MKEKEKQKRPTTGQIYLDAVAKEEKPIAAEDIRQVMQRDYEKHVIECLEHGKKKFDGDFFIHVETKKERLTPNVIRNYFLARKTCSTPWYDQTIYRYDRKAEMLEFLWVIPAKDICIEYKNHALEVPAEERDLLNFILEFYDGTLMARCKRYNGEQPKVRVLENVRRRKNAA